MTALHAGWYLIGYTPDLPQGIAPLQVGDKALMSIREGERIRVLDATCPHRGASLAHGGELHGSCVRCPFHGRLVGLGDRSRPQYVREYPTIHADGMLFAKFSPDPLHDNGFRARIEGLAAARSFVKVIDEEVSVPP